MELLWGIDLGGTKIEGVVLRPGNTPEVLARLRVPTEAQHGYHHIVSQIENLVQQLKTAVGSTPQCLGIGTPGTIDAVTRTLKNSNTTCLIGQPLHKDLERILGTSIVMANDANCFALAEATLGAARGLSEPPEVIFGSIMGTGVGGGIVVNGHIINGRHGIAGEWGHNYLDAEGGDCYCGRQGCVETVISGPALERYYARVTGRQLPLKVIDEAHRAGSDPHATATINRLVVNFGKAMAALVNILDPAVVVLGGGVGNIEDLYTRGPAAVQKHLFNPTLDTQFLRPKLGDSAGVFGAAMLTAP